MERYCHCPVACPELHKWHPPRHRYDKRRRYGYVTTLMRYSSVHLQYSIMLLWLLLIQVTVISSSQICNNTSSNKHLFEIAPKRIHIQENAPLTLTCSILPEFRDEYNATDLYFIKNKVYDAQHHYVTFPNNYQAVLYIPRAKHDELRGLMQCEMRNWNTCFHHSIHIGTHILFRRDPLMPVFNSCVVHNWESLECSWSPTRQKQIEHTITTQNSHTFTYDFVYAVINGSTTGDFHHCQCISSSSFCNKEESLNETCILHTGRQTNTFLMGRVYDLSVHARTDRGDQEVISWMEQHQQHFNTSHYVKPSPVEHLLVDNVTQILSWKRPNSTWTEASNWDLIYNISWRTRWSQITSNMTTVNTSFSLSLPFTRYEVNVTVKPQDDGYWSDVASINYTTPPVAPHINPVMSVIGYEYTCSHRCKALLHWKPVKASQQNGPNFKYVILSREPSRRKRRQVDKDDADNRVAKTRPNSEVDGWRKLKNVPGYDTSSTIIDVDGDLEIAIVVKNSMGEMKVTGNSMHVLEKNHALNVTEVLVVEVYNQTSNKILVSLQDASPSKQTTYMFFWQDKHEKDPVNWLKLHIDNRTISNNITLDRDANSYKYGLGRIQGTDNSGIHWDTTQPLYSYGGLADPPSSVHVTSSSTNGIDLRWSTQWVGAGHGRIIWFDIQFCSWSNYTQKCNEDHVKTVRLPGTVTYITLNDLERSTQYLVNITSVTRVGRSTQIRSIYVTTKTGLTAGVIGGIAVAAVVVTILIIIGIYTCWKKSCQMKKWYSSGIRVVIPKESEGAESVSSATPFLSYSYHQNSYEPSYRRSTSLNSMDSGQWSQDDVMSPDEINGYACGRYASPHGGLRSIPEDGAVDDVFTIDSDQGRGEGFVQSYNVNPRMSDASATIPNGYMSNQTCDGSRCTLNHNRSGIGKYVSVAIDADGHDENERAVVSGCDGVRFTPGSEQVRLGSDDRVPSPDTPCSYTQVQAKPHQVFHNPFKSAFQSANRGVSGKPPQHGYLSHNGGMSHGKATKQLRSHKHRNSGQNNDAADAATNKPRAPNGYVQHAFDPKNAPKAHTGYVVNDGTFNPKTIGSFNLQTAPRSQTGYVLNDGTFDPKTAATIDPKTAVNDPIGYVVNDGTFEPKCVGSFNPQTAPGNHTEYVINDGTFDPKTAATIDPKTAVNDPIGYVANDGTFDLKTTQKAQPSTRDQTCDLKTVAVIPNNGMCVSKNMTKPHNEQISGIGLFHSVDKPHGYAADDGPFVSSNAHTMTGSVSQEGLLPHKLDGFTQQVRDDESHPQTVAPFGYVANDGTFEPKATTLDTMASSNEPDKSSIGHLGGRELDSSGYLQHDALGSVDSLNHRLSALGTGNEYFDREFCDERTSVSIPEHRALVPIEQDLVQDINKKCHGGSNQRLHNDPAVHNENVRHSNCSMKTTDDDFFQEFDGKEQDNQPVPVACDEHNTKNHQSCRDETSCADDDPANLQESRKRTAPRYVNIQPGSTDIVDCTVPSSIACINRQSGGFVTQLEPKPAEMQAASKPTIVNGGSFPECNGYLPHPHQQNSGIANHPGSSSMSDDDDSNKNTSVLGVNSEDTVDNMDRSDPGLSCSSATTPSTGRGVHDNGNVSDTNTKPIGYIQTANGLNSNVGILNNGIISNQSHTLDNGRDSGPPHIENNNITKSEFCRPSAIVNTLSNPRGYIQCSLVADTN